MAVSEKWWIVRCEGGSLYEDFVERGFVALGGDPVQPDLSRASDRNHLYELLKDSGIWRNPRKLGYAWGVLSRFVVEMQQGDRVVTYNPSTRVYRVGVVSGPYQHAIDRLEGKQHFRPVQWDAEVARDDLPQTAKNSLASMMSVFELRSDVAEAFDRIVRGEAPPAAEPVQVQEIPSGLDDEDEEQDVASRAREKVKDAVAALEWDDMEELVAGVLRAMGYKTRMTERGGERGRDVLASPDGLGFEHPRIITEVKHRRDAIGSHDLRSFIGGLSPSDRGLYVSTGGFTKEARYEADRSAVPVTLLDIDSFVQLLLEHYLNADSRVKALVPLVPIWWPA